MKQEKFIKVYIGDDPEPALLIKSMLVATSYAFAAALQKPRAPHEEPNVLKYPEDDVDAWKTLIFWMFKSSLPEPEAGNDCVVLDSVRCWYLGERYNIPRFQDLIIRRLILQLQDEEIPVLEAAREAFTYHRPKKKLQVLMMECIFSRLYTEKTIDYEDLDVFDRVPGFISFLARTFDSLCPS